MFSRSPIIGKNSEWMNKIFEKLRPEVIIEAKMIYNAREDGWDSKDIQAKCDMQGPTISLI